MGFGMLLWLLFVAAIVVGVILLLQALMGRDSQRARKDELRALEVLNERFARGEIERDEFEERRKVLTT